jgi:hypothetical protein
MLNSNKPSGYRIDSSAAVDGEFSNMPCTPENLRRRISNEKDTDAPSSIIHQPHSMATTNYTSDYAKEFTSNNNVNNPNSYLKCPSLDNNNGYNSNPSPSPEPTAENLSKRGSISGTSAQNNTKPSLDNIMSSSSQPLEYDDKEYDAYEKQPPVESDSLSSTSNEEGKISQQELSELRKRRKRLPSYSHSFVERWHSYRPIEEHGLIGNMRTCALVSTDAMIDWFCWPHFDSPSIFASILDHEKGGYWAIRAAAEQSGQVTHRQLYHSETNVLISRFLTNSGVGQVSDFMPVGKACAKGQGK